MADVAEQRPGLDPILEMDFVIEIEGVAVAGFMEFSDVKRAFEEATYREGNFGNFDRKQNGKETFDNVTFRRGIFKNDTELSDWYDSGDRAVIDIVRLKHDRAGNRRAGVYRMYEARCLSDTFGKGDATSGDSIAVQELEISYEFGERVS